MNTLPNELILLIFDNILLITDKRKFLRTCIKYNDITKVSMCNFESNYKVKGFCKIDKYCVEKFTLEMCYESYFNMIPTSYINPKNEILIYASIFFDSIETLERAKNNNCNLENVHCYAVDLGNLDVLKWALQNKYP